MILNLEAIMQNPDAFVIADLRGREHPPVQRTTWAKVQRAGHKFVVFSVLTDGAAYHPDFAKIIEKSVWPEICREVRQQDLGGFTTKVVDGVTFVAFANCNLTLRCFENEQLKALEKGFAALAASAPGQTMCFIFRERDMLGYKEVNENGLQVLEFLHKQATEVEIYFC